MKDNIQVINELRRKYPLEALLKLAKIARSTFYYHLKRFSLTDKYTELKEEIRKVYHGNKGSYGYRRITMALRNKGILINHKTVRRLINEIGLKCMVRIKRYRSYKGEVGRLAPNVIKGDFHADKANQKWTTDITEFGLFGVKIYLSAVFDMYNGEIISYNISDSPNLAQVMDMLDKAFLRLENGSGLIFHSDQGWQYQHSHYQERLKDKGIIQSMSRKGNCLDNSVIENFFGLLKSEMLYFQTFDWIEHFKEELVEYIDYYNNDRIKIKLNGLSPIEYRRRQAIVA